LSALKSPEATAVHVRLDQAALSVEERMDILAAAHNSQTSSRGAFKQSSNWYAAALSAAPGLVAVLAPKMMDELPRRTEFEQSDPFDYSERLITLLRSDKETAWLSRAIHKLRDAQADAQTQVTAADQAVIDAGTSLKAARLTLDHEMKAAQIFLHQNQPKPSKPARAKKAKS
jgi:hypothetical protein